MKQIILSINTKGRGIYDISNEVQSLIQDNKISMGLCHLFLQHTSAPIILLY